MGVWTRSPRGTAIARERFRAGLDTVPGVLESDVVGSAYCIRDYHVDPHLGGDEGLATARAELAARGAKLVLDFVPNHLAHDHPWATTHPERFVAGSPEDLVRDPSGFVEIDGRVLACGRDPFFPAWTDVLQLDASLPEVRAAAADVVLDIAERCDGVRCDMAMLVLDDVFARTWGDRARGTSAGPGYWPTVIGAVKARHPDFVFWAEAYWDLEPRLVAEGFDACYDKRLYDRIVHHEPPSAIRAHLGADAEYQRHLLRFVENHDEPRAAAVLSPEEHRAAAVAVFTLPGVALLHEGQPTGRRIRVPVTLGRRTPEPPDAALADFFERLLAAVGRGLRHGTWAVAPVTGWPDNQSCDRLVAWTWTAPDARHVVVVNLGGAPADGRVQLPWSDLGGRTVVLDDVLHGPRYERDGGELARDGLFVALPAHGTHVLRWDAPTP
jgi:hypothetical protein